MSVFAGSDEVYRYVGGVFRDATADPAMAERLRPTEVVLRIDLRDPDAMILVDMPAAEVLQGPAALERTPTIELVMAADDAHRLLRGDLNIAVALARGKVRAKGSTKMLLKLVPMARDLVPRYRGKLAEEGRADLLAGPDRRST